MLEHVISVTNLKPAICHLYQIMKYETQGRYITHCHAYTMKILSFEHGVLSVRAKETMQTHYSAKVSFLPPKNISIQFISARGLHGSVNALGCRDESGIREKGRLPFFLWSVTRPRALARGVSREREWFTGLVLSKIPCRSIDNSIQSLARIDKRSSLPTFFFSKRRRRTHGQKYYEQCM